MEDALAAVDAGADAVGLNFYGQSSRYVKPEMAKEIVAKISSDVVPVGLFVNHSKEDIESICDEVGLQMVQLHGDETPAFFGQLDNDIKIIWARRVSDEGTGLQDIGLHLQSCSKNPPGHLPAAVLLDASSPGYYGGMGKRITLTDLPNYKEHFHGLPLILAGGLTPENVAEAIRIVGPHGVDVASGVESSPGIKDRAKMQAFVDAAKAAFS